MKNWFSSNRGLKIIALFLAVLLVWIKGQERIGTRVLTNIQVIVDNLPKNMIFPVGWIPPTTSMTVHGPRNILDLIRSDLSNFRVDLTRFPFPDNEEEINLMLDGSMFKTNLEPGERDRISVIEETIKPRQVVLHILPWEIDREIPSLPKNERSANRINIPLYRLVKKAAIKVPTFGSPPQGYRLLRLEIDPNEIILTGSWESMERIHSVTTPALDLSGFTEEPSPVFHPLGKIKERINAKPVEEDLRGVTVTVHLEKKGQ
ncbi:hypothetical protein GF373_14145 [bacterium]|nr:hypothetical protein [bacterium]